MVMQDLAKEMIRLLVQTCRASKPSPGVRGALEVGRIACGEAQRLRAGAFKDGEGGRGGWQMPRGQTVLAMWLWVKAGLYPQGCEDLVEGAKLGMMQLERGADQRGTEVEDQGESSTQ